MRQRVIGIPVLQPCHVREFIPAFPKRQHVAIERAADQEQHPQAEQAAGDMDDHLAQAEERNVKFAQDAFGTASIEKLRSLPAGQVQQAARAVQWRFNPVVDGWYLPESVAAIYAAGKQNRVALLAGWNTDERNYRFFFRDQPATAENFIARARERFGEKADVFLKLYPASTDAEAQRSASDFAGDEFIAFGTWKWIEQHTRAPGVAVYRYHFEQNLPLPVPAAPHAGEIEYVFGTLSAKNLPWTAEDRQVSGILASYWTNFAKTGDPNGAGLPRWPVYGEQGYQVMHLNAGLPRWPVYREEDGYQVMHLKPISTASPDERRGRYLFLDSLSPQAR